MTQAEDNKAVMRRTVEAFNNRDLGSLKAYYEPKKIEHQHALQQAGQQFRGQGQQSQSTSASPHEAETIDSHLAIFLQAFPDAKITIDEMVAEGDKVAVRMTAQGTHKGELFGIKPTNKQVTISGYHISRFADRKEVEHWGMDDWGGLMQQLRAK